MRKVLRKISAVQIVAIILLGILPTLSTVIAQEPTEIYPDPQNYIFDTSTATLGDRFNVSIWVKNVPDIKTWQVKIGYDDTIILAKRWFEPTWDPNYVFYGKTTMPVPAPPDVSTGPGWVGVGSALFPAPSPGGGFTGDGLLCIIEFEIIKLPAKFETLNTTLEMEYPDATFYIKAGESTKTPFDIYTDGYYEMAWVYPPSPRLAVDPTYREYGPWDYVVGWTFNETAYIDDLDPAWDLTNATFSLTFNSTLLEITGYWVDPLWGTFTVNVGADRIDVEVKDPTTTPSGDVNIITIEFNITYQGESPPLPAGSYDESPLTFVDYILYDHVNAIPTQDPINGVIRIYALMALPLPWLEVVDAVDGDHTLEFGPEPVVGKEFEVNVIIKNLHPEWKMIAYQFRLCFDDTMLEGVSVTEGPFLQDPRWNLEGTLFASRFDPPMYPYRACAVVGGILWNYTGLTTFPQAPGPDVPDLDPPVNPVLATIKFSIKNQLAWPELDLTDVLDIWDGGNPPQRRFLMDIDRNWIPLATNINCSLTIHSTPSIGRVIDLYGGIIDSEFVFDPFPDGYNGKGPNQPMDMVWPQKEVVLYARVTYNAWPVQNKIVSFEVNGPNDWIFKGTAVTNASGIARLTFRMPWQCDDAESYFGVYTVTAVADIYCVRVNDTMQFHYDYLVRIFNVTTDKFYYEHNEWVKITVEYGSHVMMRKAYPAEFWVYISDEVKQPIGRAHESVLIGGARFCHYKNGTLTFEIKIPKWAASGYAYVHVNCFSWNPTEGGWAWCPEYTCDPHCPQSTEPYPTIYIMPTTKENDP